MLRSLAERHYTDQKHRERSNADGEPEALGDAPIRALEVMKNGQLRPLTYVNGKTADVRWVSGRFLASFSNL
jgi:hypothetical protein